MFKHGVSKLPELVRQILYGVTIVGGSSGRTVYLLALNRVTKLLWLGFPVNKCGALSGVVKGTGSCQSKCHARGFEASYVFGSYLLTTVLQLFISRLQIPLW
jgi:hypothetical protein